MTRRRGHRPTPQPARTTPGPPPVGPAGASTALPTGPAIIYIAPTGEHTVIDQTAVATPRDRALCRALLDRAGTILTEAETASTKHPIGFTAPEYS